MKIERTKPKLYKNYFIVGEAIAAPILKGWRFRGSQMTLLSYGLASRSHLNARSFLSLSAIKSTKARTFTAA